MPLAAYFEKRKCSTFHKMPEWLKRLVTPDAEIVKDGECYDVVTPSDPKPDRPDRWVNVTGETLERLIGYLPKDAAHTTMAWRQGLKAIRKAVLEHKVEDTDAPHLFIQRAERNGVNTYDKEHGLREYGGKVKAHDPGLSYLINMARGEQVKLGKAAEFALFEESMRAVPKNAHFDMIRLACQRDDVTREEIEDLMMATVFALRRGADFEWIVLLENGCTDIQRSIPFSTRGNNHVIPALLPADTKGKAPTALRVLETLVGSPRFTKNIYADVDCVPTFTNIKPVLPDKKLNIFRRFKTIIGDEKALPPHCTHGAGGAGRREQRAEARQARRMH
jgi:hypothetical protein